MRAIQETLAGILVIAAICGMFAAMFGLIWLMNEYPWIGVPVAALGVAWVIGHAAETL